LDKEATMARTVRDAKLETRTARSALAVQGKPHYRAIDPGLHLGYRKGKTGGKWVVRRYVGDQDYKVETLDGIADDRQDADGVAVLSFAQAQAKARELYLAGKSSGGLAPGRLTVKAACERYVEFLKAERKTGKDVEQRLRRHLYPDDEGKRECLGDRLVAELTTGELEAWKRGLVRKSDDPEDERRSKDTANRILSALRAALNQAFRDEENGIPTDVAWRRVKPFKDVGRARQVHLDAEQSRRLINCCDGAFRHLVTAALITGARPPHELCTLRVRDFRADLGTLSIRDGKTGPRDIVLTEEAIGYFKEISAGRAPDALLLPKDGGSSWGKSHHIRPMRKAVSKAKLPKDCTIYSLRHTYASQSILAGMNLKLLAENMGTSIRMLEDHYGKFIAASRRKLVEESAFKLGLEPSKKVVALPTT
jgi:integrase